MSQDWWNTDWDSALGVGGGQQQPTPAPAPQPDAAPAPAPQTNWWDTNWDQSFGNTPAPAQPSAYDTMFSGSQAQQPNNPFAGATASGQAYQQPDYNPFDMVGSYVGNVWNAFAKPFEQPTKQDMNPFEFVGDAANKILSGGLGAFGEAIRPYGGLVDTAADSGVPGVSQAAGAVRNIWEQTVEPAGNFVTSEYGALSNNGNVLDMLHGAGPAGYLIGGAFDLLQGRDPTQYYKNVAGNLPQVQLAEAAFDPNKRAEFDATRSQAMQDAYNQIIQSGGTVDQANQAATREGMKLVNPLNLAEYKGSQEFAQLPSYAQLPIMFSHGVINPGNLAYETALEPFMRGSRAATGAVRGAIGAGARGLADVTGTAPFFDRLGNAIEGPQKFLSRTENDLKTTQDLLTQAEQQLGDSAKAQTAVFLDTESPWYWENYNIRPDIANKAAEALGVIDKNAQLKANVEDNTPQQGVLPQNETDMARRVQDTSPGAEKTLFDEEKPAPTNQYTQAQPTTRPATPEEQVNFALQDYKEARIQELRKADPGAAMFDLNAQAKAEAEAFRPQLKTPEDVANFRVEQGLKDEVPFDTGQPQPKMDDFMKPAPRPPDVAITDIHRAAGIPDINPTHGELLDFVKKNLGYERKAYALAGTKGKPTLRETRPLEQFGKAGDLLNKFAQTTMPYMGRAFLNKQGRAIRDTASNLVKYVAEDFGRSGDTNPRFERIHQMAGIERPGETLPMGKASSLADIGGKESRGGFKKELLFHVLNPFDELSSDLLRSISKGKIKDWNDFTEKAEANMKTYAYKREFLKEWDKAIDDRVRTKSLDPEIAQHLKNGTLSEKAVADFMAQKLPKGASLDDMAKAAYNPQNYSDALRERYSKMFGSQAGPIGDVVRNGLESLQDRVDLHNKENRLAFEAKTKGMDPDSAEYKTARATYDQVKPLTIQDVKPGHPVWEKMKSDIFKQLDVANAAAKIQESMDPAIRAAVRDQIVKSMEWVEGQRRINTLKQFLANRIDTREQSGDFQKYERQSPRPAEPAQPTTQHSGYTQRNLGNVEKMKLFKEVMAYKNSPGHEFSGNQARNFLNKPEPGKILTRYQMADGPHFRVTTPEELGKNGQAEVQVWPLKAAEAPAAPAAAPGTPRERILQEIKATGYNEAHAQMGMALLDAYADAYSQRTGRSPDDVYDKISFQKGEEGKPTPGALQQTAGIRGTIESGRAERGETNAVPDQNEIPGFRTASSEDEAWKYARQWENRFYGGPARTEKEQIDRFVRGAMSEIAYQMSLPDRRSGLSWYSQVWQDAMNRVKQVFPEMNSDVDAEKLFKLFTGLTSQGTEVGQNMVKALEAFERYAQHGRIRITRQDAEPFNPRALGLNEATLSKAKDFMANNMRDWTDFTYASSRLDGVEGKDRDPIKANIITQGNAWLKDNIANLGFSRDVIPSLRDLFSTERFRGDTPAAIDWLSKSHTKAEFFDVYKDMVQEYGTTEVLRRALDVEYPGNAKIPGTRALGPTPLKYGTETANFIKLADLVNRGFNGDLKATIDWLTTKHYAEEFRPVAEILYPGDRTKQNGLVATMRAQAREDAAYHKDLGDVPKDWRGDDFWTAEARKPKQGPIDYPGQEYGSGIFGPKIGNFVANLFGADDRTTKDLWFTRTWNRLMGEIDTKGLAAEFKEQPTSTQRPIMDKAMAELMKRYRAQNVPITQPQAQALLWFYEKQLAEAHGRASSSEDFASVADASIRSATRNQGINEGRPTPPTYRNVTTEYPPADTSGAYPKETVGPASPRQRPPEGPPLLPQEAGKKTLGTTELAANGKYVISIFKDANASTMPHELAHVFRQLLPDDLLRAAQEFTGATSGKWTVPQEEMFARGFERYLRDGKAPTPTLQAVFEQFRQWLVNIYRKITGSEIDVKLTPEIKKVFDQMLGGDADKIVARETTRLATPEEKAAAAGPAGTPVEPTSQFDKTFNAGTASTSDKDLAAPARSVPYEATATEKTIPKAKASPVSVDKPWVKRVGDKLEFPKAEYRLGKNGLNEQFYPITSKGKPTDLEIVTRWQGNDTADRASDLNARWVVRNTKTGELYSGSYRKTQIMDHVKSILRDETKGSQPSFTRLSQTADEHTPEELAAYDKAINAPQGIRMDTGDGKQGQVLAPNTLRKIVANWNRGLKAGDLVDDQHKPTTKAQYTRDILATDEYIRSATGNTFKLDLDNFTPVRISDGKSLDELLGRTRQSDIGEPRPKWPAGDPPNTVAGVLMEVQNYFGKDARKGFAQLKKEQGQAAVDMAYSELAKRLGFPDPTNPATPTQKMGFETSTARKAVAALEADARDRYTSSAKKRSELMALNEAKEQTRESLDTKAHTDMAKMLLDADRNAYKRIEGVYFDYRNKNVLDQAMGSLLPFNFWARRNFAYIAKYFANNPVQFAAVLQFYKNMEQENQKAGGVASYNMGNLLLWTNPDGSKVQWNMSSMMPLNPLGNSDSLMQLIDATDAENGDTVNKTPLAFLFGADRMYNGKVTGRDKGIIPSFLSPNPVIDILLKTGVPNDFAKKLGIVTDGFGSPDPSDKRAVAQTTGLVAGRLAIRDIADRIGLTKIIREEATKLGIKFTDLDLEAPLNELIFGVNAGKPLTAVIQELTEMAQGDPKHQEQYLMALAKLKQGNWTPEALKALDTVEAQGAWQRAASMAGFVSVVNNTPRQQLASNLSAGYGQVAGDKGHYVTTSVDPKTGYETKKFVPGGSQEFFKNNPGAEVAFDKNKTPDQIIEGIGNNKTSQALADLNKAYYDDKSISLKAYNKGLDDLKAGNPTFFKVEKDKAYQEAKGELPTLPGQTRKTVAEVDAQYAKQEIPSERKYAEYKDELYRAEGSGRYQELAQKINDLYNSGQKAAASALSKSPEYVALKAARDAVNAANPTEAARKKAEDEAKYGPSPTSSTATGTGASTGGSTAPWTAAQKSLYGRLLGQGYSKAAATSVVNKAGASGGSTGSSSRTTSSKSTGSASSGSSATSTWDASQKKLYGQLIAKGYSKAAAASVVNKQQSTSTTGPTGAATPFTATTTTSKIPATSAGAGTTASTWDNVQRKAYALALADGYSKAYATSVANKIGSGESTSYRSKLTGAVASYGSGGKPAGGSTTASKPLTTQSPSQGANGVTTPAVATSGSFWQRNANGDVEAIALDMQDAGWRSGAGNFTSYAAAQKVAYQQMANDPNSVRVVIYNPDSGSFGVWQKATMNMSQEDDALLRSETVANANSARYTNGSGSVRSGGGGGGSRRASTSSRTPSIHLMPSPWRVPSPYSGTLNRANRGRKF